MPFIVEIIIGIATNILSTKLLGTADKKSIEKLLKDPAAKLTDSARSFCRSENISEPLCDAVLERAGQCVADARFSLDDLETVQFDVGRVLEQLRKKQVYTTSLSKTGGEEQHLFKRFVEETVRLLCRELPRFDVIHRETSVKAGQAAQEHHETSSRQLEDLIREVHTMHESQQIDVEVRDSLHSVFQRSVQDIRQLIDSDSLVEAETKTGALLNDLGTHFRRLSAGDHAEAFAVAASLYAYKGNTETADAMVKEAESRDSDNPRVLMVSAKVLALHKDYQGALAKLEGLNGENARILRIAIKHELGTSGDLLVDIQALEQSDTEEAHSALASYYMTTGDFSEAAKHARSAVELQPNSHNLWMLGYSLIAHMLERRYGRDYQLRNIAIFAPTEQEMEQIREARGYLSRSVEIAKDQLGPTDNRTIERKLHLLQCLALYDEDAAIELALAMLRENPSNFEAARYLLFAGRVADAVAILEKVDQSNLEHESDACTLAGILTKSEQPARALDILLVWRDQHRIEDDYHYTYLLCRLYRILDQPQQALNEIRSFGRRNGITIEQRKLVASHFAETGYKQIAENTVDRILEVDDSADNVLFAWATLEKVSDPARTTDLLTKLTGLAPKREFYVQLIKHLFHLEDYTSIIKAVANARASGLTDRSFDKAEAMALYYLGDYAVAEPVLRETFEKQESDGWIEQGLGANLAMCSFITGNDKLAIHVLVKLTEQPDAIPEAYAALIDYYDRIGRYEDAYDQAQAASARFPSSERARASEVMQGMSAGYMSEAIKKMESFAADFPESKIIFNMKSDDGPEYIAAFRDRQQQMWDMYQRGDVPRAFVPDFSRFAMALSWTMCLEANTNTEAFPKPPTYVASGSSAIQPGIASDATTREVVLDYTAMLSMQSAGILEQVFGALESVYYPPQLLAVLLYEIQRLSSAGFHIDRKIAVDKLVTAGSVLATDWPGDWAAVRAELDRNYDAADIGLVNALELWFAHEMDGYYLDEYLLENPHMDTSNLPPDVEVRIVTIRDLVYLLRGKLSGVQNERAVQYIEQFGCASKVRTGDRSGDLSIDRPLVVNLTTLESLHDMGILDEVAAAYKGRISLSPFAVEDLRSRLREAQSCENAKACVEAIQRAVIRCDRAKVVRLGVADKALQLDDVDAYSQLGLMFSAANAALKTNTALIADDRAVQRLSAGSLRRGTTLALLSQLLNTEAISDNKYEECYLKMLQWNCLFLPLDEFVVGRVLARTPIDSKDARLIANYYDGAFGDPGLSAVPYSTGSIDSEAFRYYVECNKTLIRVLLGLWSNPEINRGHKVAASELLRDALWRKPEQLLRHFSGRELADSLRTVWHVRLLLSLQQEESSVAVEFLKWYIPEWLNPEAVSRTSIAADLASGPTDTLDDLVPRAEKLRERLSGILPAEILGVCQ